MPGKEPAPQFEDLRLTAFRSYNLAVKEFLDAFDAWRAVTARGPSSEDVRHRFAVAYCDLKTVLRFSELLKQYGID